MTHEMIPWSTRLSNVGLNTIKAILSRFSICNGTDTDIGIDLDCILTINNNPVIPFHVQAKGTEHFNANWRRKIKKTTVEFWLTREAPVYLIVYDDKEQKCYWKSVEDNRDRWNGAFSRGTQSISVNVARDNILGDCNGKNEQFTRTIIQDYVSLKLAQGYPPESIYDFLKKKIPLNLTPSLVLVTRYNTKPASPPRDDKHYTLLKERIRSSVKSLITYHLQREDAETASIYCEFLTKIDKAHYDHFLTFGRLNRLRGNYEVAEKNFEEALSICERDEKWPRVSTGGVISIDEIISGIKRELTDLRERSRTG